MKTMKLDNFVWIDIPNPSHEDIQWLEKNYHFHPLALEDCISSSQRPKLDDYDDYLFLVLHLPRFIKDEKRTVALEINFFLGDKYLITVHRDHFKPLEQMIDEAQNHQLKLHQPSPAYLLYEILNHSYNYCFPMLDKIAEKLDRIEDELYHDQSPKTLEETSLLSRDIINFRRIINPQRYVIKDLETLKTKYIAEDMDVYFDDVLDKIERIWELLDNYKEVTDVLRQTNESLLSHRLNEIIKVLTVFSVLMLPLTVVTGFYGMNVRGLPFSEHRLASEIIFILLIGIVTGMLYYFNRKRWL